jgi:hypothetical protein
LFHPQIEPLGPSSVIGPHSTLLIPSRRTDLGTCPNFGSIALDFVNRTKHPKDAQAPSNEIQTFANEQAGPISPA